MPMFSGPATDASLDQLGLRLADGQRPLIDLQPKIGIFWSGVARPTLDSALTDLSGAFARPTPALHMGVSRLLATSAIDGPALSYILTPAVTPRGLAIERASRNIISSATGAFGIASSNATQVASPARGPDGGFSLWRVTSTANGGYIRGGNYALGGDSSYWTWSLYTPKTTVSNSVRVDGTIVGGNSGTPNVNVDTLTGVGNSSQPAGDWGVIDAGDFWLVWFSYNVGTSTLGQMGFYPGGAAATGTADYGWTQIEPGHSPTSRIKTVGTAGLRRERDALTIPVVALSAAGTVEVTAAPAGGAVTRVLAQVDDGTEANRVTVQRNTAGNIEAVCVSAGVTIATMALGTHTARDETRVTIGWSGTTMKAVRDGAASTTATGAIPVGLRTLRIGANSLGLNSLDGPLARVAAWPGFKASPFYNAPGANFVTEGDSMAAGAGVSTAPEQWGSILAVNLQRTRTNMAVGGTSSTWARDNYLGQAADDRAKLLLLWTGHNNPNDPVLVMADIASIIAAISTDPAKRRFLIGLPTQNTTNAVGSTGFNGVLAIRQAIITAYPDNYVDLPNALRAAALAAGDTAASDANIANGYTPARYLADTIHLVTAGHVVVEAAWRAKMLANGY